MAIGILNSSARTTKILAALEGNWQAEMEGYRTYQALADRDTEPVRSQVLRHLAHAELEHAELWAERIKELGGDEPVYHGKPGGWRLKKAGTLPATASN
jgi:rubrerythrin